MAKFFRRADLGAATRAEIALEALRCRRVEWGGITDLARRHGVSRMFVYGLIASLTCFFSARKLDAEPPAKLEAKRFAELLSVALRVFCDGSVGGISRALKAAGLSGSSVGTVSALLAEVAAATGIDLRGLQLEIVVLADEIFACGRPILVIMDARTHCVLLARLAGDRKGCTWKECFASLQGQGVQVAGVVKDQGSGLHKGARDCGLSEHADLFHLQHPFDPFLGSLERKAYAALDHEDGRLKVFLNRRTEASCEKALLAYEEASAAAEAAVRRFDAYSYLHLELHEAFNGFAPDGSPKARDMVGRDVDAILDLMVETAPDCPKLKDAARFLRDNAAFYWGYFDELGRIVASYAGKIPGDALKELCLAWQKGKKAVAVKSPKLKKAMARQAGEHRTLAVVAGGADPAEAAALIDELEGNVRSSSPLEAINSVIRDNLNACRGQISQGRLDMLVYSINHNVATRGRYKGTSAWQRLTGRPESSGVVDQLLQLRDAKRTERSGKAAPSMPAAVEIQPPLGKVA